MWDKETKINALRGCNNAKIKQGIMMLEMRQEKLSESNL